MLERDVYSKQSFKDMSKYFVFVKINGDRQPDMMRRYRVEAYPTLKFMRADGSEIGQHVGYAPLSSILKVMNSMRK